MQKQLFAAAALTFTLAAAAGYRSYSTNKEKELESQKAAVTAEWQKRLYTEMPMTIKTNKTSTLELAREIFEDIRTDGKLGIRYRDSSDVKMMPPKSQAKVPLERLIKTPAELLKTKIGDCSDMAHAFVWIFRKLATDGRALFVEVYRNEAGKEMGKGHACVAILTLKDGGEYKYGRFENDAAFRSEVLRKAGVTDRSDLSLVLIDPATGKFGAQYTDVRLLNIREELASFLFQRGTMCTLISKAECTDESFHLATLLDPDSPTGNLMRGIDASERWMDRKAISLMKRAAALKPDWAEPYGQMSDHYARRKKWNKAQGYANRYNGMIRK